MAKAPAKGRGKKAEKPIEVERWQVLLMELAHVQRYGHDKDDQGDAIVDLARLEAQARELAKVLRERRTAK